MNIKRIARCEINIQGGTQAREEIDQPTVNEYADAMEEGAKFPPVVVFHDSRLDVYWLADGFHRYHACIMLDIDEMDAEVHDGTRRDAILYAAGANKSHGLRRSNQDKRNAVLTLLEDEEWGKWSDNAIARHVSVHHNTVAKYRKEIAPASLDKSQVTSPGDIKNADFRVRIDKHGGVSTINTANIGRRSTAPDTSVIQDVEEFEGFGEPDVPPVKASGGPSMGADDPAFDPPKDGADAILRDAIGQPVPEHLRDLFASTQPNDVLHIIRQAIAAAKNMPAPIYTNVHLQSTETSLRAAARAVKFGKPYAVCPRHDQNKNPKTGKCTCCKNGCGWLTKLQYENHIAAWRGVTNN